MPNAGPPGGRPPRGPDDGDHRRPGADGREPALHRRHRDRRLRDAAHPLQPAGEAAHRLADGVLVQRPDAEGERRDEHRRSRRPGREEHRARTSSTRAACARAARAWATVSDFDLTALYDDSKSLNEGALTIPGYSMDGWYGRIFSGAGLPMDKPIAKFTKKQLDTLLYEEPTKIKVEGINLTYEGIIPKIQKSMLSKDVEAMQPHVRAFVERAITFTTCPECDGTRLSQAAPVVEDRREEHRRPLRDADQRPGRLGPRPEGAVGGAAARRAAAPARLVRGDRAGLPLARPAGGDAVRGRGAAHQDDPPPRLVAHRRHLRLRRAHDRPAPARHRADEPAAAPAARQGQHRAGRRAQAGDHRDRRPRGRPRSRRRHGGRHGLLRGHRRGAAEERHDHRPPPRRPGLAQGVGPYVVRRAGGPRRVDAQPAEGRRRHPARRALRPHRRRRLRQELAGPGLGRRPGRRRGRSTRARSAARGAATRRRTAGCSSRSARRSRRPTA